MSEKLRLKYSGKSLNLKIKRTNLFSKFFGLMFRSSETENLLFDFAKDCKIRIHSFFVFFSFIAIWLDEGGEVIALRRVRPFDFNLSSKKSFSKVIEIPINKRYSKLIGSLVGDTKSL